MTHHIAIIGQGAITRALLPLLGAVGVARISVLVRPGREGAADDLATLFDGAMNLQSGLGRVLEAKPALVVEAAGQGALAAHGVPVLEAGIPLVAASVGALADDALYQSLLAAARQGGARLHLPSGAIGGIDALVALSGTGPVALSYTGTKPAAAWPAGSAASGVVFRGTAREAAMQFPKNANVAATLALAGPGLDATEVTLMADPDAVQNTHAWHATADAGEIEMRVSNAPTTGNAATSLLTVHSRCRTVRNLLTEVAL